MVAVLDKYRKACKSHRMAAGTRIVRPNEQNIRKAIDGGYTLIALGLDNVFLDERAKASLKAAGR